MKIYIMIKLTKTKKLQYKLLLRHKNIEKLSNIIAIKPKLVRELSKRL